VLQQLKLQTLVNKMAMVAESNDPSLLYGDFLTRPCPAFSSHHVVVSDELTLCFSIAFMSIAKLVHCLRHEAFPLPFCFVPTHFDHAGVIRENYCRFEFRIANCFGPICSIIKMGSYHPPDEHILLF
jgi:hypothetical protein